MSALEDYRNGKMRADDRKAREEAEAKERGEQPRPVNMNDLRHKLWLAFQGTPLQMPLELSALAEAICRVEETTAKHGVKISWPDQG